MFDKLKQMRDQVKREMELIPRGPEPQMEFRMLYWTLRMRSLGKKGRGETRTEVIKQAREHLRKYYPNFVPAYDVNYFK